jgi:hypothetical protein
MQSEGELYRAVFEKGNGRKISDKNSDIAVQYNQT